MKHFIRFVFGLLLITGCAKPLPPSNMASHEQEGIGGDLAAFYAKSVTVASLEAKITDTGVDFEVEEKLRTTPVFSGTGFRSIVNRRGSMLWVDRQKVRTAHPCEIARSYLLALGELWSFKDFNGCNRVDVDLSRAKQNHMDVRKLLSKMTPKRISGNWHRYIRSRDSHESALASVSGMEEALKNVNFVNTFDPVFDVDTKSPDRPEKIQVDTITSWDRTTITIDKGRLSELPELAVVLPVFLLHELNHVTNPNELPDRSYGLTQELFSIWLGLN